MQRLITAPTSEPLTLADAKAHLRVDFSADDDTINALITAARQAVETHCRLSLMPQVRQLTYQGFKQINYIAYGPVRLIDSIKYLDPWGDEQALDPALYVLHKNDDYDYFTVKPTKNLPDVGDFENAITVEYQAGYATAGAIPRPLLQAMLLHIGDMYENRERNMLVASFANTGAYEALLSPYIRLLF